MEEKERKSHRERSPINIGMLDLGEVFFFPSALLVRRKNKAAVTKENTPAREKKRTVFFLSLGKKLNDSKQFTT